MRAYDEELAAKLAKADDQDQVKASIEPEHSAFTGGAEEPCKAEEVLKTPTGWSSGANAVRAARPLRRSSGAERSKTVYLSSEATPLQALRSESSETITTVERSGAKQDRLPVERSNAVTGVAQ